MKTKPMWGLWLLMIVAPVAVFVSINHWKQTKVVPTAPSQPIRVLVNPEVTALAAKGQPLISDVGFHASGNPKTEYIQFFLCNPTRKRLKVSAFVISGSSEFISGTTPDPAGHEIVANYTRFYSHEIKKNRSKIIHIRFYWSFGNKREIKNFLITPQMNSKNKPMKLAGEK